MLYKRCFSKLKKDGIIKISGKTIEIEDMGRLRKINKFS